MPGWPQPAAEAGGSRESCLPSDPLPPVAASFLQLPGTATAGFVWGDAPASPVSGGVGAGSRSYGLPCIPGSGCRRSLEGPV